MKSGVEKAVIVAGGATELARYLQVTHQAVYLWRKRGWVPASRAVQIEKQFKIPRRTLVSARMASLLAD